MTSHTGIPPPPASSSQPSWGRNPYTTTTTTTTTTTDSNDESCSNCSISETHWNTDHSINGGCTTARMLLGMDESPRTNHSHTSKSDTTSFDTSILHESIQRWLTSGSHDNENGDSNEKHDDPHNHGTEGSCPTAPPLRRLHSLKEPHGTQEENDDNTTLTVTSGVTTTTTTMQHLPRRTNSFNVTRSTGPLVPPTSWDENTTTSSHHPPQHDPTNTRRIISHWKPTPYYGESVRRLKIIPDDEYHENNTDESIRMSRSTIHSSSSSSSSSGNSSSSESGFVSMKDDHSDYDDEVDDGNDDHRVPITVHQDEGHSTRRSDEPVIHPTTIMTEPTNTIETITIDTRTATTTTTNATNTTTTALPTLSNVFVVVQDEHHNSNVDLHQQNKNCNSSDHSYKHNDDPSDATQPVDDTEQQIYCESMSFDSTTEEGDNTGSESYSTTSVTSTKPLLLNHNHHLLTVNRNADFDSRTSNSASETDFFLPMDTTNVDHETNHTTIMEQDDNRKTSITALTNAITTDTTTTTKPHPTLPSAVQECHNGEINDCNSNSSHTSHDFQQQMKNDSISLDNTSEEEDMIENVKLGFVKDQMVPGCLPCIDANGSTLHPDQHSALTVKTTYRTGAKPLDSLYEVEELTDNSSSDMHINDIEEESISSFNNHPDPCSLPLVRTSNERIKSDSDCHPNGITTDHIDHSRIHTTAHSQVVEDDNHSNSEQSLCLQHVHETDDGSDDDDDDTSSDSDGDDNTENESVTNSINNELSLDSRNKNAAPSSTKFVESSRRPLLSQSSFRPTENCSTITSTTQPVGTKAALTMRRSLIKRGESVRGLLVPGTSFKKSENDHVEGAALMGNSKIGSPMSVQNAVPTINGNVTTGFDEMQTEVPSLSAMNTYNKYRQNLTCTAATIDERNHSESGNIHETPRGVEPPAVTSTTCNNDWILAVQSIIRAYTTKENALELDHAPLPPQFQPNQSEAHHNTNLKVDDMESTTLLDLNGSGTHSTTSFDELMASLTMAANTLLFSEEMNHSTNGMALVGHVSQPFDFNYEKEIGGEYIGKSVQFAGSDADMVPQNGHANEHSEWGEDVYIETPTETFIETVVVALHMKQQPRLMSQNSTIQTEYNPVKIKTIVPDPIPMMSQIPSLDEEEETNKIQASSNPEGVKGNVQSKQKRQFRLPASQRHRGISSSSSSSMSVTSNHSDVSSRSRQSSSRRSGMKLSLSLFSSRRNLRDPTTIASSHSISSTNNSTGTSQRRPLQKSLLLLPEKKTTSFTDSCSGTTLLLKSPCSSLRTTYDHDDDDQKRQALSKSNKKRMASRSFESTLLEL